MIAEQISLTTTCMNRNAFLYQSLKTWVKFPFAEIIIVSWGNKKSLKPILEEYPNHNIKLIEVKYQDHYHYAKARNFKVQACKSKYVMSIDCDVMLGDDIFKHIKLDEDSFHTTSIDQPKTGVIGTSIIPYKRYMEVNGCNERMAGWGSEDIDLYSRLNDVCQQRMLNSLELTHIEHDDNLRVCNTPTKDKWRSNSTNCVLAQMYGNNTEISNIDEYNFESYTI